MTLPSLHAYTTAEEPLSNGVETTSQSREEGEGKCDDKFGYKKRPGFPEKRQKRLGIRKSKLPKILLPEKRMLL